MAIARDVAQLFGNVLGREHDLFGDFPRLKTISIVFNGAGENAPGDRSTSAQSAHGRLFFVFMEGEQGNGDLVLGGKVSLGEFEVGGRVHALDPHRGRSTPRPPCPADRAARSRR